MKLYVEKREVRTAGMLRDAYAVVDENGDLKSMPYPTRQMAVVDRNELVADIADYEIGNGKRPKNEA